MTVPFDVSQYVKSITDGRPAGAGNPIRDGKYLMILKSFQIKPSDKNKAQVWFIAEFRVMRSEPVEVPPEFVTAQDPVHPPNGVGQDCSLVTDLNSQMGGSNVKEVIAADLGVKHDTITAEQVAAWLSTNVDRPGVSTGQPKAGRVFACNTTRSITKSGKNANRPGVRPHWDHVPQTEAELQAIRSTIEVKPAF